MADRLPADAVLITDTAKFQASATGDLAARAASFEGRVEAMLGVDRTRGQRGWIRNQGMRRAFVTADPKDMLNYPVGDPREGRSRYNWVESETAPAVRLGYLKDKPSTPSSDVVFAVSSLTGETGMGVPGNA